MALYQAHLSLQVKSYDLGLFVKLCVFHCSRKFCFAGDPARSHFILNVMEADNLTIVCIAQRSRHHPVRSIFSVLSCVLFTYSVV
jgi:hypothetical protein